jgi:predicted nucleotidyltransferase
MSEVALRPLRELVEAHRDEIKDARPIEILSIGVELEGALRVKVDVGTPTSLRERLRDEVLAEAVPL